MKTFVRAVVCAAAFAVALPFLASEADAVDVMWKGVTWSEVGPGSVTVDGNDHAIVTRTGPGQVGMTVDAETLGLDETQTPWIEFTYIDDGSSFQGIDVFVESNVAANPRLQAGSLFNCDRLGYERLGIPAVEDFVVANGPNCGGPDAGRTPGQHTVRIGKRADNTVDMQFDGVWYTGTFLKRHIPDSGVAFVLDGGLLLRWRDTAASGSIEFVDFQFGTDHVAPVGQPDGEIRRPGDAGYVGLGTINTDGAGQTKSVRGRKGATRTFKVRVNNTTDAEVSLAGTAGNKKFKARYYDNEGQDITEAVVDGTYTFTPQSHEGQVQSSRSSQFLLEVTVRKKAKPGNSREFLVTADADGASSADVVKAVVSRP